MPIRWRPVALVVFTALLSGCGGTESVGTLARLRQDGVVRVGYANEAPYAFRDSSSGRVTGEAPEIARIVFGQMGVGEIDGVLTEFGSLIPGLQAGRFDVIAAGMYITPERCAQVAFSEPTYAVGEGLVVAAGNPLALHSYQDVLDHPTASLGVVAGAIERRYAEAVGIPEARIVTFPDALSALAGVRASRVSAYGGTALTVRDLIAKDSNGVEEAEPFSDPMIAGESVTGYGAFAFRLDDDALLAAFNRQLSTFIGTPGHLALVQPFGFTARERPGDITTADVCRRG